MSVVPRHGDKEAGGRPTQHGVGVLLLQISRRRPSKHYRPQWRRSWGVRGVKGPPPHFPEGGHVQVVYKAVTPSFDAMLMSLFRYIYWLWTQTVVVDQVLL